MNSSKSLDTTIVDGYSFPGPAVDEAKIYRLTTVDGLKLHVRCWNQVATAEKLVVIVHGFGAHGGTYQTTLVPDLLKTNTVVFVPDLRGHGFSEGSRGHMKRFEDFHLDLAATIKLARQEYPGLPLYLLGESMGTSIVINYTVSSAPADKPDGVVLLACVIAPTVTPQPVEVIRFLYNLVFNRNGCAIPITGREEQGVRDPEAIRLMKEDVLYLKKVSVHFMMEMVRYMKQAAKYGITIKQPVFLAQGGRDIVVNHRQTCRFFNNIMAEKKEIHYFPEAFHSILNDPDSPQVRRRLLHWLDRMAKSAGY